MIVWNDVRAYVAVLLVILLLFTIYIVFKLVEQWDRKKDNTKEGFYNKEDDE